MHSFNTTKRSRLGPPCLPLSWLGTAVLFCHFPTAQPIKSGSKRRRRFVLASQTKARRRRPRWAGATGAGAGAGAGARAGVGRLGGAGAGREMTPGERDPQTIAGEVGTILLHHQTASRRLWVGATTPRPPRRPGPAPALHGEEARQATTTRMNERGRPNGKRRRLPRRLPRNSGNARRRNASARKRRRSARRRRSAAANAAMPPTHPTTTGATPTQLCTTPTNPSDPRADSR